LAGAVDVDRSGLDESGSGVLELMTETVQHAAHSACIIAYRDEGDDRTVSILEMAHFSYRQPMPRAHPLLEAGDSLSLVFEAT